MHNYCSLWKRGGITIAAEVLSWDFSGSLVPRTLALPQIVGKQRQRRARGTGSTDMFCLFDELNRFHVDWLGDLFDDIMLSVLLSWTRRY